MKGTLIIIITNIVFILAYGVATHPFEVETHRNLSGPAVLSSTLDNFLKNQLDFAAGVDTSLNGSRVIDHISQGSVDEDNGLRFLNHFHNPLRTWNQAGLLGGTLGASSVVWGQDSAQGFSWQKARDEYFLGLTATIQGERDRHFANVFRALGQLIHLVQDMGQPAHTRNDPHPVFNGLEGYVENIRLTNPPLFSQFTNSSQGFDPSILTVDPNPLAPIPLARITDTTDPDQAAAVPSAGVSQGLAEYSNANFLSEDTIFKDFTFPRVESLGSPFDGNEPVTGRPRRYFPKVADGETINRFVAEGAWTEALTSIAAGDKGYILDRGTFEDYTAKLLPRAIGYSAGLIDYFFRGRLSAFTGDIGCVWPQQPPISSTLEMVVSNASPAGEETGAGQVDFVVHYEVNGVKFFFPLVSQSVFLERDQATRFQYSTAPLNSVPPNAVNVFMIVTYRGPLGQETNAVIGGRGDFFGLC
jgi:hypothetical protein